MTVAAFPPRRDKPNYRMRSQGNTAEIFLYDTIGSCLGGISAQQFAADLKALGTPKTINLRINSDGGDVFEGRAIYSQLARSPARIVAYVDGIAASIASLIAMAATEIRLADGAWLMIHNVWSAAIGDAAELREMADLLDSVSTSIAETYAARTRQPIDKVQAWMNDETWMTGEDAVAKGFADVLDEPVKVAASLREPGRFRHLPAALHPRRAAASLRLAETRELIAGRAR